MLDAVMAYAVIGLPDVRTMISTLELKTNFISIGHPGLMVGKGAITKLGKSIVFFDGLLPLEVTKSVQQFLISQSRQLSELEIGEFGVADIPNQGEWVRPGQPFCTLLAREEPHRVAEVLRSATSKVREAFQRFGLAQ